MRHKLAALCAMAGAVLFTHDVHAVELIFAYDGSVLSCPDTGFPPCGDTLFPGDDVNGLLVADTGDDPSPTSISSSRFTSFSFQFGDIIDINSSNSMLVGGLLHLDSAMNVAGGSLVIITDAIPDTPTTRLTLQLGASFWAAGVQVGDSYQNIANGVGKLRIIPVPGAVFLFAPALLAFLGLRRRDRQ